MGRAHADMSRLSRQGDGPCHMAKSMAVNGLMPVCDGVTAKGWKRPHAEAYARGRASRVFFLFFSCHRNI